VTQIDLRPGSDPARVESIRPMDDGEIKPRSAPWASKAVLMLADVLAVSAAMITAIAVSGELDNPAVMDARHDHLILAAACVPVWLLLFGNAKLYSFRFVTRVTEEFRRIARTCVTGTILMTFATVVFHLPNTRGWILTLGIATTVFVTAERFVARRAFNHVRRGGGMLRPVVVVGGNAEGLEICHMLEADRSLGYEVRGFVDDQLNSNWNVQQLGAMTETLDAVRRTGSTGVIIAATAMDLGTSNRLIRELTEHGIHVELSSTLRDIASYRLTVRPLGRFPVVYVEPVQRGGWRMLAKRCLDLVLASLGLLIASPALLLAAVGIKANSKGPVIFRQDRVGRDGKVFKVLKLRTMVTDAEKLLVELRERNEADGPLFKMKDDPRITKVGRVLRKLSIDELPQLWNVIRNEMSMVGPRPALPQEVEQWGEALHGRLRVKPGITGMWQVNGRSSSSFEDYERLDLYYVDNWSLATDLAIVAKTIPAVLFSRGAY
jgi:exopolysaccharide biosynthesis polyprenyl glycosylphosphotransferase